MLKMTILKNDNIVAYFRHGQILVGETVAKISDLQKEGKLKDGQFNFLLYLLSKKELSFKDVSIITLSLYGDGLNSVRTDYLCMARQKLQYSIILIN